MGFDDRNLIQDVHMDDTLYKTGEAGNMLLDAENDQQVRLVLQTFLTCLFCFHIRYGIFEDCKVDVTLMNGGRFAQSMLCPKAHISNAAYP